MFNLQDHKETLIDLDTLPDGEVGFDLLIVPYAIGEILVEAPRGKDECAANKPPLLDTDHHLVQGAVAG